MSREFQSHLGSILPPVRDTAIPRTFSFNPTLVRFCRVPYAWVKEMTSRFNPTLVRFCLSLRRHRRGGWRLFQSHLGSILPNGWRSAAAHATVFQSHLGSILPDFDHLPRSAPPPFQSHLGSILPKLERALQHLFENVSIPPWFDFAAPPPALAAPARRFQSHLGSILPDFAHLT